MDGLQKKQKKNGVLAISDCWDKEYNYILVR